MQKTKHSLLFGAGVLVLIFLPLVFVSAELQEPPAGPQTFEALLEIIDTITNWVFAALMATSVIFIMLAGFQFIMEGKDPAKVTEAKNKVLFAIGGIAIALAAKGFEPAIRNILDLNSSSTSQQQGLPPCTPELDLKGEKCK